MLKKSVFFIIAIAGVAIASLIWNPFQADNPTQYSDTQEQQSQTREYWIKAEEILWDYAPSYPVDEMMGMEFNEDQLVFVENTPNQIGRIYRKAVYSSYTPQFKEIIDGPDRVISAKTGEIKKIRQSGSSDEHLGLLGPTIRAEVGDRVIIHFKNETRYPVSLHSNGLFYSKANEGIPYQDGTSGLEKADDAIAPNDTYTYVYEVPESSAPTSEDLSSIVWPYYSATDLVKDVNSGLIGAIIVYSRGSLDPQTNLPQGIDREFVNIYQVIDENSSLFLDENIKEFTKASIDRDDEDFIESNLMHGINGLLYSNLKGLDMKQNDEVRWYIVGLGTEVDIHTPHWHGNTLLDDGHRVDTTEVFPATVRVLDMLADDPGVWMYHCHVDDHIDAGMSAVYKVDPV
ncbi:MAG: multicopper oxidase domain-containing protein [Prochloraceae cyanobacterium]